MIEKICFPEDRCLGVEQNPTRYVRDGSTQSQRITWKLSFYAGDRDLIQVDSVSGDTVLLTELVPTSSLISITIKRQVEDGPETKKSKK